MSNSAELETKLHEIWHDSITVDEVVEVIWQNFTVRCDDDASVHEDGRARCIKELRDEAQRLRRMAGQFGYRYVTTLERAAYLDEAASLLVR